MMHLSNLKRQQGKCPRLRRRHWLQLGGPKTVMPWGRAVLRPET